MMGREASADSSRPASALFTPPARDAVETPMLWVAGGFPCKKGKVSLARITLPASPGAVPRFRYAMGRALIGVVALMLLFAALATLYESRDLPVSSEEPTLADIHLTTSQPSVGAVVHLRARYTNTGTEPADVRVRLFGTRREFTVLGPLPPPLMHLAPGQQLFGDIAFIVGQSGPFGGEFVVTDEGFVKLAEQPFPELAVRPLHPLALLLGTLMLLLVVPTAISLVLMTLAHPGNCTMQESLHKRASTRTMPGLLLAAVFVSAGISLTSVALTPVLRPSILAAVPLLVPYPTLGLLAPAVAFLAGGTVPRRIVAVGGSAIIVALLAWIATGAAPFAFIGAILGGTAALLGTLSVRRAAPVTTWAGLAILLGALLWWASSGWETYRAQVDAILASRS